MCGICGWLDWSGETSEATVRAMTDHLIHRGPDAEGYWRSPDGVLSLGHRRLRVLDLHTRADQPMVDAAGNALVYNGEVYSYPELRSRLEVEGHSVTSTGDTEVVHSALTHWHESALPHFNGMFALAFWNSRQQKLLLVRDRIGIKPLFWARTDHGLVFGSEIPALLTHPHVHRDIEEDDLAAWLQLGYLAGERSLAKGIRRIPPGFLLEATADSISVRPWYDLVQEVLGRIESTGYSESTEELEHIFKSSVGLRLVSHVPLGCFLSGGVDSTAVAAAAAQENRIETLTISFEGGEDESPAAITTADSLGLKHVHETCTTQTALQALERWPEVASDPIADPSLIPTWLVSNIARKRWTVALSGDGGDELFGGYPRLKHMPMIEKLLKLPPTLRRGMLPVLPASRWAGKLRAALACRESLQAYQCLQGVWPAAEVQRVLGLNRTLPAWPTEITDRVRDLGPDIRYRLLDTLTFLPERVLAKVDRASMANSLEVRVPLLDHRVVEQVLSSTPRSLTGKRPLRRILTRLGAPDPPRAKRGFEVPLGDWLRGPLRQKVETSIQGRSCASLDFDSNQLSLAWQQHLQGGEVWSERLLAVVVVTRWVERWMS
jgi:asparagine synthase (glutamine-hydrolysing)